MDLCCRASCSSIRLNVRTINWSTRFFLHDPVTYLLRFRGPRDPPRFVSRSLRSQKVGGAFRARVIVLPATRTAGLLARGRERDLPGSQTIHPVPLPRSPTPAEPTIPRLLTVSSMLPPLFPRQGLQRLMNFGAQSRGFGTC